MSIVTGVAWYRNAIATCYQRTPGSIKRYPQKLEDLLTDPRYLNTQRYLRQLYRDPITGDKQWGLVAAPQGGIMGVYSLSEGKAMKTAGFRKEDAGFENSGRYADWRFTYEPPGIRGAPQPLQR